MLVIAAAGHADTAMIGEILGGHLRRIGCRGIVCDGAVRDVAELASWDDFSVFSRHVNAARAGRREQGRGQCEASTVGGLRISPGDLVIGDDDGLAVALSRPGALRHRRCRSQDGERSRVGGKPRLRQDGSPDIRPRPARAAIAATCASCLRYGFLPPRREKRMGTPLRSKSRRSVFIR